MYAIRSYYGLVRRFQTAEARLNVPSTVGTTTASFFAPRAPLPAAAPAEHGGHGAPESYNFV